MEEKKQRIKDSTRLKKLSIMNNTHFGAFHYDIHLDMKLDYTISLIFQEMSLTELETLHQLSERTQILQSLALAVLKVPLSRIFFIRILWLYSCTKKLSPLFVSKQKTC